MAKKSVQAETPAPQETQPASATDKKGKATPKRPNQSKARPPVNPPLTAKEKREAMKKAGPLTKEQKKQAKDDIRAERGRIAEGQWKGDPLFDKYHLPRDRGPERLLVRDIVDSRWSVGQYYMFGAFGILILSTSGSVQLQSYLFIALIALTAVIVIESVLLARRVKRIVFARFPKSEQRKGGLYWYAIQRSIMPRSMRSPRPRMSYKAKEDDLGKVVK
ncbi:DUF3043 domain-containing protein [Glycomyces tritici]|uniref:DUF3043 domain-containing protein n=1 Tax=Glycomyces tritici TaxID=2665176 RepID=A0ABT7YM90_9ACTN|nr:DUF3043 domain-containing protein [Glycomyces tritici]MDN3239750.1 DUF3043 domain-containing protein [Glycomyces tritici]